MTSTSTWAFEEKDSSKADAEEKDRKKKDDKNENMFNNVEYQYVSYLFVILSSLTLCGTGKMAVDMYSKSTSFHCRLVHPKQAPNFSNSSEHTEQPPSDATSPN